MSGRVAQRLSGAVREFGSLQIVPSSVVEPIVGVRGTQQFEEVDAAFGLGRGERGEVLVAMGSNHTREPLGSSAQTAYLHGLIEKLPCRHLND